MQIREIMAKNPLTIRPDESVATAAAQMRDANVGCLLVTNSADVQGILTDRDLAVRCLAARDNGNECQVSQHMSSPVTTISAEEDLLSAAHLMTEQKMKRLPVMENGELAGLVSFSDIAQALDQPVHELLIGMGAARRAA